MCAGDGLDLGFSLVDAYFDIWVFRQLFAGDDKICLLRTVPTLGTRSRRHDYPLLYRLTVMPVC